MTQVSTGARALDRAADLVAAVVHADEPMSFADLHDACGLAKSTTSRMLAALERGGLLERDAASSYVAGRLFWLYAARHDPWEELVRLAHPVMERIRDDTGETVHLSVARDDRVVQVAQANSTYLLGTRDWTEIDVPTHCSALGQVLLAWGAVTLPDSELVAFTPHTLVDRGALESALGRARELGWATTQDELEIGLSGVAVPVFGARGDIIAAMGVSGPTSRIEERLDDLGSQLLNHSSVLSSLLRSPAPGRTDRDASAQSGGDATALDVRTRTSMSSNPTRTQEVVA